MHERCISEEQVEHALASGMVIESYATDQPYPSALLLGHAGIKAIHIVCADDFENDARIIITVYEPDPTVWHDDLKTRRQT